MITKHSHQEWKQLSERLTTNGHQAAANLAVELQSYIDVVPSHALDVLDSMYEQLAAEPPLALLELDLERVRIEAVEVSKR